jgi:malate dehydrogenase
VTPFAVVIGAGEVGGATAQAIAALDCVREVRLIDSIPGVAAGKALDITQSAATEGHATHVSGADDVRGASGAAAIVLADAFGNPSREWHGEEGLALLRRLWGFVADDRAVIVCAGTQSAALIRSAVRELHVDRRRIVGTAPAAFESGARALTGVALDGDGSSVSLMVLGDPPSAAVPCWSQATVAGAALTARLSAAQLHAIESRLPRLWPPGAYSLASAAARAVRAIACGSRGELTVSVALDGEMKMRNVVAAMPVRLGPQGVVRIIEPDLSPQERVRFGRGQV